MKKLVQPPSYCYHTKPSTGELVLIRWGRMGYFPVKDDDGRPITGKAAIEFMQAGNASLGITQAQADAMMAGSMFGWNVDAIKAALGI